MGVAILIQLYATQVGRCKLGPDHGRGLLEEHAERPVFIRLIIELRWLSKHTGVYSANTSPRLERYTGVTNTPAPPGGSPGPKFRGGLEDSEAKLKRCASQST